MAKNNFFKTMLALCLMALCWFPMSGQDVLLSGDVDGDGEVSISDVSALIDYLLTDNPGGISLENADVDGDGEVDIADVAHLIDILLTMPPDTHKWVDLGLPSGTLWATCNVGANSPEEYGDYFAWGETAPKDYYDWSTYKWRNGSENTLTKYCTQSGYGYNGFVDNKTELDPEDDAACVNWGTSWRMPTLEQIQELCNTCSWQWTLLNGVSGQLVTGPSGNTLFFPAAGYRLGDSLGSVGLWGTYLSRILYSSDPSLAYYLGCDEGQWGYWDYSGFRRIGLSVRAVRVK